jgi:hypothetical protein
MDAAPATCVHKPIRGDTRLITLPPRSQSFCCRSALVLCSRPFRRLPLRAYEAVEFAVNFLLGAQCRLLPPTLTHAGQRRRLQLRPLRPRSRGCLRCLRLAHVLPLLLLALRDRLTCCDRIREGASHLFRFGGLRALPLRLVGRGGGLRRLSCLRRLAIFARLARRAPLRLLSEPLHPLLLRDLRDAFLLLLLARRVAHSFLREPCLAHALLRALRAVAGQPRLQATAVRIDPSPTGGASKDVATAEGRMATDATKSRLAVCLRRRGRNQGVGACAELLKGARRWHLLVAFIGPAVVIGWRGAVTAPLAALAASATVFAMASAAGASRRR